MCLLCHVYDVGPCLALFKQLHANSIFYGIPSIYDVKLTSYSVDVSGIIIPWLFFLAFFQNVPLLKVQPYGYYYFDYYF